MTSNAEGGRGPAILAVGWTFASVSGVLLAMRIYVRLKVSAHGTWALIWTAIAYLTTLIESVCATIAVHNGLGNHMSAIVAAGTTEKYLFWTWMACFWFDLNVGLSKIAAASFLIAVHADTYPIRRYILKFIAASNMLFAIPDAILLWLQCSPPNSLWNPLKQSDCTGRRAQVKYTIFLSAWSGVSDIAMVIMPVLLVWNLQMRLRSKAVITILMGLGLFAAVGAFMVGYYVKDLNSSDASYDLFHLMMWGKAAGWLVIISTSVPPVAPLFRMWASKAQTTRKTSRPRENTFIELRDEPLAGGDTSAPDDMKIVKHVRMETTLDAASQEEHNNGMLGGTGLPAGAMGERKNDSAV